MRLPIACLLFAFPFTQGCHSPTPAPAPPCPLPQESTPEATSTFETEKRANEAAYAAGGFWLGLERFGQWVLICDGQVQGVWPDFEDAETAAAELAKGAQHAFLFRVGIDDKDEVFSLSPFLSSDPHWQQLGQRLTSKWGLSIYAADNTWARKGMQVTWGDQEARIQLEAAGSPRKTEATSSPPKTEAAGGTPKTEIRAVASALFEGDLCITTRDAKALGAGKFHAPGTARYAGMDKPSGKLLVHVRIPELGIDQPAMAFVLPAPLPGK